MRFDVADRRHEDGSIHSPHSMDIRSTSRKSERDKTMPPQDNNPSKWATFDICQSDLFDVLCNINNSDGRQKASSEVLNASVDPDT